MHLACVPLILRKEWVQTVANLIRDFQDESLHEVGKKCEHGEKRVLIDRRQAERANENQLVDQVHQTGVDGYAKEYHFQRKRDGRELYSEAVPDDDAHEGDRHAPHRGQEQVDGLVVPVARDGNETFYHAQDNSKDDAVDNWVRREQAKELFEAALLFVDLHEDRHEEKPQEKGDPQVADGDLV